MKDLKQRPCETMGFNCPDLVRVFICADHVEFTYQKIGNDLAVKRIWKRFWGEELPCVCFLK